MLPPLNALRSFEAVIRHKKYSDAANELCVTTSAISHQIRVLEDFFGVRLINRDGQKFALTTDGEVLAEDLHAAFNLIKRATVNLQTLNNSSPIGVSTTPLFAVKWLRTRLHRFWELHTDINLHFYHNNSAVDVTDGSIQVAVQWLAKCDADVDSILLIEGNLTPACNPAILEQSVRGITPAELAIHSLLHGDRPTFDEKDSMWRRWLEKADVPDLKPAYYEYYEDGNVRIQAAIQGEGFVLVCPTISADDIASGRLVCPFDTKLQTHAYYIVTPSGIAENANVKSLVKWFLAEAG